MTEDEKENAVQFYLNNNEKDLKTMAGIDLFFEGQSIYAERCKALLNAALEGQE